MAASGPAGYRLVPLAEADLENIWLYTREHWSESQADSYFSDIFAAFSGLASGRKQGRRVDIRAGYFKYPLGSHLGRKLINRAGLMGVWVRK